jgi:hypothetical protein
VEKLEKLAEALIIAITGRNIGYGIFLGFVISLCVTSVTILLLDGVPLFSQRPPVHNGLRFFGEFMVLLVIITALTVFMTSRDDKSKQREENVTHREEAVAKRETAVAEREADDLLSSFREQMIGLWEMNYRVWTYDDKGEPKELAKTNYAKFDVDQRTKKLTIRTRVTASDDFEDDQVRIEAISIWPVINPTTFDYYHDLGLTHDHGEVIRGPIFVHLDIDYEEDVPVRLRGTWYDLDGVFARTIREHHVAQHGAVQRSLPLHGRIFFSKTDLDGPETKHLKHKREDVLSLQS